MAKLLKIMRNIIGLFTFIGFLFCVIPDTIASYDHASDQELEVVQSDSSHTHDVKVESEQGDCKETKCGDESCKTHGHAHHNRAPQKKNSSISIYPAVIGKLNWYYNNHYKTPSLSPGVFPPIFS